MFPWDSSIFFSIFTDLSQLRKSLIRYVRIAQKSAHASPASLQGLVVARRQRVEKSVMKGRAACGADGQQNPSVRTGAHRGKLPLRVPKTGNVDVFNCKTMKSYG